MYDGYLDDEYKDYSDDAIANDKFELKEKIVELFCNKDDGDLRNAYVTLCEEEAIRAENKEETVLMSRVLQVIEKDYENVLTDEKIEELRKKLHE